MNNTITLIEQGSQHPTLIPSQDSVPAVLLLVVFPQGTGLGPPHDVIPHLIQPSPPVRQARAYRAPEGAVNVADNVQSGALGYWNKIAPPVIVVRVRLRLDVGVGVEHLSMNGYHEGQHPGRGNSEEAEL